MDSDHFVKVFDVLDSGFKDMDFSGIGLILVAVGIGLLVFPKIIRAAGVPYLDLRSKWRKLFPYCFLGFAVLWTVIAFSTTYLQYLHHKRLAQENSCRVVEGAIEHFVPVPRSSRHDESFLVSGVLFKYSDFTVTDGFNNTSSYGGPITSDSYVRICYDPLGNVILRLEIRDFAGPVKNYAAQSILPRFPDTEGVTPKHPAVEAPWYETLFSSMFIVLLALDFIGTRALFLPYLRTFVRLKTTALRDCRVPSALQPESRIKLRNSTIYWDKENRAIWLRPRGFNVMQVPGMVATLKIDANGTSIAEDEIRFSSGFIFVIALFLLSGVISEIMPAKLDSSLFAKLFVLMAVGLLVVVNLPKLRSRMEKLVQDALSEFRGM